MLKKYWESSVQKISASFLCSACVFVNLLLIYHYGDDISFPASCWMNSFTSWYLPLITSITGILFWYRIMYYVADKIMDNNIINFLSENTFLIMEVHLFFINIPNFYVMYRSAVKGIQYTNFDRGAFENSPWLGSNESIFSFFTGLVGSVLFIWCVKLFKAQVRKWHLKVNCTLCQGHFELV